MMSRALLQFMFPYRLLLLLLCGLGIFSPVNTALAKSETVSVGNITTDRTYQWLPYFIKPCRDYNVPLALALAIARQESGTQPWVINVSGKGYFPKTKEEARIFANEAWRQKRSFDVGIMQINSYWLKRYNIAVEEVLEPQNNINMGVWILAKEIQRYGLTWKAIGSYHTPLERNPKRAEKYANNVIAHMREICDKDREIRELSKDTIPEDTIP